jgi:hypothetical protein
VHSGDNKMTRPIKFAAEAIILHRTYIRHGKYSFKDLNHNGRNVTVVVAECGGISLQVNSKKPITLADQNKMMLSTVYRVECIIDVDNNVRLFPAKNNNYDDWPRSSKGRRFLENVFLSHMNFFFENILYFSDKKNPNNQLFSGIRPIGTEDIVSIDFILEDKRVAAQGNSLNRLIAMRFKDSDSWPKSNHIARSFKNVPIESSLLLRTKSLIDIGFYREAVLIAFSVLDAKVQELIEKRMNTECSIDRQDVQKYLRNVSQQRLTTIINFFLKCIDKTSLKENDPALFAKLDRLNSKRNRIIHNGEEASREEAQDATLTIARVFHYFNKKHKGYFDVPLYLLDEEKHWMWL